MKFNELVNNSKYCFGRIVENVTGISILKRKLVYYGINTLLQGILLFILCFENFDDYLVYFRSKSYELVFPGNVSEPNVVPHHIMPPMYVVDQFEEAPKEIIFKTDVDLPYMRQSCSLAKKILNAAGKYVKVSKFSLQLFE